MYRVARDSRAFLQKRDLSQYCTCYVRILSRSTRVLLKFETSAMLNKRATYS